ncbi:MAG: malto-oligosyltrehalose synthase, partial [Deltaproteobacteria bacterium]|nr:malto-oligosyltrehalose synthase [Nannocystaceae bacterium]
ALAVPGLAAKLRAALQWPELATAIDEALAELAGTPGDPASTAALHALLDEQAWRLAYWRSGLGEINYRRFFDIPELVAMRSEDEAVFTATHALVAELLASAIPVGLRVDHIDGLADPRGYIRRLRDLGAKWILIEKILGDDEVMRGDWMADGTTGYEGAAMITRCLLDPGGARMLHSAWQARSGNVELEDAAREAKLQVLDDSFATTLRRLAEDLRRLTISDRRARDVSLPELERALRELTAALPVYRTYFDSTASGGTDRELLAGAIQRATLRLPAEEHLALEFIDRVLRGEPLWTDERASEVAAFVRRWQQLTAPLAAKGVEDTLLYRWTALGALNEVGAHLSLPVDPCAEFHQGLRRRRRTQRAPLLGTATHDTKRGEDARARLGVLSQMADSWLGCAEEAAVALAGVGEVAGDRDELELLLQSWVSSWPCEQDAQAGFAERLHGYATKAMREAKRHTNWTRPAVDYERSMHARVDALVDGLHCTPWGERLLALQQRVSFFGAHDSLAQLVLKLAAPGVCDIYQGNELWDFSLVDPDNRRAVDFDQRAALLGELAAAHARDPGALLSELREHWSDGRIKAFVTWRGLQLRHAHPDSFVAADLRAVHADGGVRDNVCALARQGDHEGPPVVAAVARLTTRMVDVPRWPIA